MLPPRSLSATAEILHGKSRLFRSWRLSMCHAAGLAVREVSGCCSPLKGA